jgi:hypothetical protein
MSTNEPPFISPSDLVDAAADIWRDLLVTESQSLQPDGCCTDPSWRGHLCQYHQGYADGIDMVLIRLREGKPARG